MGWPAPPSAIGNRIAEFVRARVLARAHKNIVVVALANKLARIAWAVLAHGGRFDAAHAVNA